MVNYGHRQSKQRAAVGLGMAGPVLAGPDNRLVRKASGALYSDSPNDSGYHFPFSPPIKIAALFLFVNFPPLSTSSVTSLDFMSKVFFLDELRPKYSRDYLGSMFKSRAALSTKLKAKSRFGSPEELRDLQDELEGVEGALASLESSRLCGRTLSNPDTSC